MGKWSPSVASAGVAVLAYTCLFGLGVVLSGPSPGISPDSVTYLDLAQSVLSGGGLSHRWAYWDPVYETCHLPTKSTMWPPG